MIYFTPFLGWPVISVMAVLSLAVTGFGLYRRARGSFWRLLGFCALIGLLAGPQWELKTVRPLSDIVLVAMDQSQSMQLGNREALAVTALRSLQAQAAQMPDLQLRVVPIPASPSGGTALFASLTQALAEIPAGQLAGIVAVTDGELADIPAKPLSIAPMTALLAAQGEETDRELRLIAAPQYGLVGKTIRLQLEVLDHGVADAGAAAPLIVTEDGQIVWQGNVAIGEIVPVDVPVRHAGPAVVIASVAPLPGEVSQINDRAAFSVNGITRRLDVLLISGNPDESERSWRLLLKSDPAVELVHFTILRTPEETLDAPPEAVALVPFPVEQLFNADIDKFDLIILDEFNSSGLLPPQYLQNMADYVQGGGALLVETGPEFEGPQSLAATALGAILPAIPAPPGTVTQSFPPIVTALGARHPVTAPFAGQTLAPWQRLEAAATSSGDVLMTGGADNWPLLVLADASKGRVGMLLSDQFWLWTRGGDHAGPALPLLRRVVHWLLREPALEPEFLNAQFAHESLQITRQTLSDQPPGAVAVTAPDGHTSAVTLSRQGPGVYAGSVPVTKPGVWRVAQGGLNTYAIAPFTNAEEYQDLAATGVGLQNISQEIWLGQNATPDLASMIAPRHAEQVTGARDVPLAPPIPAAILVLLLLVAAWWRERG